VGQQWVEGVLINREFRVFIAFESHQENLPNKDEEVICCETS